MYFKSVQSEWMKRKRSAASWLTVAGAFFIPGIVLLKHIIQHEGLPKMHENPHVWEMLYTECWQYMAFFLLPMGIILATSLVVQLEYKNNGWRQLYTTPQSYPVIFFAKLTVILIMLLQFFVLFNIGIFLVGAIPALLFGDVPYPQQAFPFTAFLEGNGKFFIACLPVLALQYLFSVHFKNFIVPIGIGFALVIASLIAIAWRYGYTIPYTYAPLQFMKGRITPEVNIYAFALGYFFLFTVVNYLLYINKKSKG